MYALRTLGSYVAKACIASLTLLGCLGLLACSESSSKLPSPDGGGGLGPSAGIETTTTSGKAALTVGFQSVSTDPDGTIVSYTWSFGDGASSALPAPRHTFVQIGAYQVSLTVTDNDGNTDTALVSIVVEKPDEPSVTVVPTPQFFAPSSDRITLDSTWRVVFDPGLKNIAHTTGLLTDKISGTHGFVLTHQTADEFIEKNGHLSDESEKTIFLLRHNDRLIAEYFSKIGDSLHDYTQQIGDKGFEQGYLLFTYGKNVFVLGKTAQGVFYGVQSLLQILEQSSEAIAGFTIIDYPEIEHRVIPSVTKTEMTFRIQRSV